MERVLMQRLRRSTEAQITLTIDEINEDEWPKLPMAAQSQGQHSPAVGGEDSVVSKGG